MNEAGTAPGEADTGVSSDPPCALCGEERPLRNSHIISEFLYSAIYDDIHRFHVITSRDSRSTMEQKGYREKLLCQDCETKLSRWEGYARSVFAGEAAIQVRQDGQLIFVSGLDYARFKLFQMSILWRAAVAKGAFFGKVKLGPHTDRLRAMLRAEDPGEPWRYGCLMVSIEFAGQAANMIMQPTPARMGDASAVRFTFGGLFLGYRVASHAPLVKGQSLVFLQRDGTVWIKRDKLENAEFFMAFLREATANWARR